MTDIDVTVKVNTHRLKEKLEELPNLEKMRPTELEKYIKKHLEVVLIGNPTEKRFYVTMEDKPR